MRCSTYREYVDGRPRWRGTFARREDARRFVLGGRAHLRLRFGGASTRFTVRAPRRQDREDGARVYFVDWHDPLAGLQCDRPGPTGIGTLFVQEDGRLGFRVGRHIHIDASRSTWDAVEAFAALVGWLDGNESLPYGWKFEHLGTCGACGKRMSAAECMRGFHAACEFPVDG